MNVYVLTNRHPENTYILNISATFTTTLKAAKDYEEEYDGNPWKQTPSEDLNEDDFYESHSTFESLTITRWEVER